jgi:hypothetical protein
MPGCNEPSVLNSTQDPASSAANLLLLIQSRLPDNDCQGKNVVEDRADPALARGESPRFLCENVDLFSYMGGLADIQEPLDPGRGGLFAQRRWDSGAEART